MRQWMRQRREHLPRSITLRYPSDMQTHASNLLTEWSLQDRRNWHWLEWHRKQLIPYNPSLLWTFLPLARCPSFNSPHANSSFQIYCNLNAFTSSLFSPNQVTWKFCSRRVPADTLPDMGSICTFSPHSSLLPTWLSSSIPKLLEGAQI